MATSSNTIKHPERLLTYSEVAAVLACSVKTVRRRVESGELAVVHDGRLRRVRPSDLDRYVRIRHALLAPTALFPQ